MKKATIILFTAFLFISCELYDQDDYNQEYVIESYLIANQKLPNLYISTTSPIFEEYDRDTNGITNATVILREFDPQGNLNWTEPLINVEKGTYRAINKSLIVLPRHLYTLEVTIQSDNHMVRAETVVPDTFSIRKINATSLVYQGLQQFELDLSPSFYPGRQGFYVFANETLDPLNAKMTPFYADSDGDREDFYRVSSGIVNETSTGQNGNTIIELKFPWIGIAFYGPNRLSTSAIDDNMYDFIRSVTIQQGGSTQSPGEIENFISNVEGGIGVFGSFAQVSVDVEVLESGAN